MEFFLRTGLGVFSLVIPAIFFILFITVWATIKKPRIRLSALLVLVVVGLYYPVTTAYIFYKSRELKASFSMICDRSVRSEIRFQSDVPERIFYKSSPRKSQAGAIGERVFSRKMAERYFLSGEKPVGKLVVTSDLRNQLVFIGENGDLERKSAQSKSGDSTVVLEWVEGPKMSNRLVSSATLQVKDATTDQILGSQVVLLGAIPLLKAFPGPAATPWVIQKPGFLTCPHPIDVARFVKSIFNADK